MNISHEHKLIWVSPEMSGTEHVSKILENNGFLSVSDKNETELLEEYSNYKLICGMRNPYERVFLLYFKDILGSILVKKDHFEVLKTQFNEWVRNVTVPNKLKIAVDETFSDSSNLSKHLKKWTFEEKIPDFFVKIENLTEDLNNLGFKSENFNLNDEKTLFKFNEIYEYDTAKRIYHLYKKHFYLCDYDPFSFTTEEIEDYKKIDLIHDIL